MQSPFPPYIFISLPYRNVEYSLRWRRKEMMLACAPLLANGNALMHDVIFSVPCECTNTL